MARLTSDESLMDLLLFLPSRTKLKQLDLCGKTRQLNSSCRAVITKPHTPVTFSRFNRLSTAVSLWLPYTDTKGMSH